MGMMERYANQAYTSQPQPEGIDDGGQRISYGEGKAIREPSTGKGRYDLISPFATRRLARWYELGAQKYADRNWEKGIPFSRYVDSAKRHLDKYIMGMNDGSGVEHFCNNAPPRTRPA